MKTITLKQHRTHLGKVVLFTAALIALSVCLIYMLAGFTPNELDKVINLLLPINALYVGAVFKYAVANPFKTPTEAEAEEKHEDDRELNEMYVHVSKVVVYGHLAVVLTVLWFDGLGILEFAQSMNIIRVVESFFGLYAGLYLSHIFGGKEA